MEMEILEEKENVLLGRKELRLNLKHANTATPSKAELLKELVAKFSTAEENIIIDYIRTKKGVNESIAKVKLYKEKVKKKEEKSETQTSKTK